VAILDKRTFYLDVDAGCLARLHPAAGSLRFDPAADLVVASRRAP